MRYLTFLLIFQGCCVVNAVEIKIPAYTDYTAYLCWDIALDSTVRIPDPAPEPTPTPDDKTCKNCGGDGILGDGVVKITCPQCGGDGIIGNEQKTVLKKEVRNYIKYKDKIYVWRELHKDFFCPGYLPIEFNDPTSNPENTTHVKICDNGICETVPIKQF